MKKFIVGIIAISILLTYTVRVDAADLLWRLTHGDQDALIIGEIIEKKDGKFIVKVHHVIDGDMKDKRIALDSEFNYSFLGSEPKVDDYAILSIDRERKKYKLKWGAFKAKASDYKTLKLYNLGLSEGLKAKLTVFEYYINSDGQENNFYFKESNAYVRTNNGETIRIYPGDSNSS